MIGSWLRLGMDASRLALEAQTVVTLRLAKLARGGPAAAVEATRMVTEKVAAAGQAVVEIGGGASPTKVMRGYRKRVRANRKRLSRR